MLMKKRAHRAEWQMVEDDDPHFARFWDAYPRRVSKKDARKAWVKLDPSPALVDQMIAALAWQVPHFRWDSDKQEFAPYPASWLNAERWTDEQPIAAKRQRVMGDGASVVFQTLRMHE